MSKITTDDCKQAIIKWIESGVNSSYFSGHTIPHILTIKRLLKKKSKDGFWVREFAIDNNGTTLQNLFTIENCDGSITVSPDDPYRTWSFWLCTDDICDDDIGDEYLMVYFIGDGLDTDIHCGHLIEHRLPSTAFETMESVFQFPDMNRNQIIETLLASGFVFLGYNIYN